jgi:hypothetical protein
MPRLTFGARVLSAGRTIIGPFTVPEGLTRFVVTIDTTQHLNPGVVVTLGVEMSQDAGATWQVLTTTARGGGVVTDEDTGAGITTMHIETLLPQPNNLQRRLRFGMQIEGGSLTTAGGAVDLT